MIPTGKNSFNFCCMEGEACPKLLDLIPRERDKFVAKISNESDKTSPDEKKLELRLGPPGIEWSSNGGDGYFSQKNQPGVWYNQQQQGKGTITSQFLQFQSKQTRPVIPKESSQPCCTKGVVLDLQQSDEKKVFSPPAVPNTSQKRYFYLYLSLFDRGYSYSLTCLPSCHYMVCVGVFVVHHCILCCLFLL